MSQSNKFKQLGKVELFETSIAYRYQDPIWLFNTLCEQASNSLLLESAETSSKKNLKSLLIVDAAVRIVCMGHTVTFSALTANGKNLLSYLQSQFDLDVSHVFDGETWTLKFQQPNIYLDEDARLRDISSFDALRLIQNSFDASDENEYAVFLGGLFSYDLVANFELLTLVEKKNKCPDYVFYVAETLIVIDHQQKTCQLQGSLFEGSNQDRLILQDRLAEIEKLSEHLIEPTCEFKIDAIDPEVSVSDEDFCKKVNVLKESVIKGDVFQVVYSRCFTLPCSSPLVAYKELKNSNPSPYMFYMKDLLFTLFGASPESALKYDKVNNQVEVCPIAGTRSRGTNLDGSIDFDLDSRIELELRMDIKEQAEHMMLVDLARNDVARISQPGTRYVAELLKVDRYSHVMHLVSRVIGKLRNDLDALHAYQACMNMGTLTGAPKVSAMQLLRKAEGCRRGSYGGAIGYLTGTGAFDTCIVIRSAYVENGIAQIQAGAGVVFDSNAQSETNETRNKAQAVILAIQKVHQC